MQFNSGRDKCCQLSCYFFDDQAAFVGHCQARSSHGDANLRLWSSAVIRNEACCYVYGHDNVNQATADSAASAASHLSALRIDSCKQ